MTIRNILLLKQVDNLGKEGETTQVKAGYANNFLFPRKLAILVNDANRKQIEALKKARAMRETKEHESATFIAEKLTALPKIAFSVKTGENGKMFGSISAHNLLERLAADGLVLDKKTVHFEAIKTLGQHTVSIKLHPEVSLEFTFEVVSENPLAAS
jgi:large subunit ribosomal protein L9